MKRLVTIFVLLFGLVGLASCKPAAKKDTVKPVITVPSLTREIYVGDTFNPLLNVTAKDDVDGDITSKIEVNNKVDNTKAGTYDVIYTVKDKAGNTATLTVKVKVNERGGLANLINGDFTAGLEGWSSWHNESQDVEASVEVVDGKAVIDITKQSVVLDNNWWDVQLKQTTINFKKFESYTLKITAYADNPRYMMVNLQGGGLMEKAIDSKLLTLQKSEQTFSIDFFGKQDAVDAELQFAFGTFHKVEGTDEALQTVLGKVYIVKVEVVHGPELENQAPVIEGAVDVIYPVGATVLIKGGLKVSDDFDSLTIDDIVATPVGSALDANVAGVYRYKYVATDSEGLSHEVYRNIHIGSFNLPPLANPNDQGVPAGWEAWSGDGGEQVVTTADGVATVNITAVGPNAWHNQFKVVGLMALRGEYTITFSAKASVARTIVFALEPNYGVGVERVWHRVNLTPEFKEFTFTIALPDDAKSPGSFQFFMGDAKTEVGFEDGDFVAAEVSFKDFSVAMNPNAAPTLTMTDTVFDLGSQIDLFKGVAVRDDHDDLTLEDIVVEAVNDPINNEVAGIYRYKYNVKDSEGLETVRERNIVVGSFVVPPFANPNEDGVPAGWVAWSGDGGVQTLTTADGKVAINITAVGPNAWHNQFKLGPLMGTAGTYEISFKASSSVARTIVFASEQDYGVGVPRVWHRVNLTTTEETFTFTLTLPEDARFDGWLQFFMGNAVTEPGFEDGVYVPSIITISEFTITKQ